MEHRADLELRYIPRTSTNSGGRVTIRLLIKCTSQQWMNPNCSLFSNSSHKIVNKRDTNSKFSSPKYNEAESKATMP